MTYTIAPAALAALRQATALWPDRDRGCDGTIASSSHLATAPKSFHNPSRGDGIWTEGGVVLAFDLTHSPEKGCDAHRLVRAAVARGDRRISEAISQGRIWTRARAAQGWRPYTGANPHNAHAHVSIAWEHRNDTGPWWKPAPIDEEPEMTPAEWERLENLLDHMLDDKIRLILRGESPAGKLTHVDNIRAIRADIAALDIPRKD